MHEAAVTMVDPSFPTRWWWGTRYPHSEEIAEAIAYLAPDRARHITGEGLNVAAGSFMRP